MTTLSLLRSSRLLPVVALLAFASRLFAHDPPEEYYARNITVELTPVAAIIHYRMELSQVSLFNLPNSDKNIRLGSARGRAGLEAACMERFKILIPDNLIATLNDRPLTWIVDKTRIEPRDSTHFHLHLRADWEPTAVENKFEITDGNFEDAPGPYRLEIDGADGVEVKVKPIDPRGWTGKGVDPLKQRTASAIFLTPTNPASEGARLAKDSEGEEPPPHESIWANLRKNDLAALLSTNYGLWLMLLIATVHGAGHSLMPGHGKTMVAAYLVGERGTPWHAVLLGIVTTLTHTSAAIGVALLIRYALPAQSEANVSRILQFLGGFLIAGLGCWLFLQRLAGRSDHVHLFEGGLAHSHGDSSRVPDPRSTWSLILLGIAGGILPCWGAVIWVIGCISTGQLWLALPIVLAFSIGLASVLILIGLSVVYAGRIGQNRWGERPWFRRIFNARTIRWLHIGGAAFVAAIGFILCATSGIGSFGNR